MKRIYIFAVVCLVLLHIVIQVHSQTPCLSDSNDIKIDPRQYVTVTYIKPNAYKNSLDTIWNWEYRKSVPNQKINNIDINGEIRIDFSRLGLFSNVYFEGTVSLEAEISGINGNRKIEVNPYSEVGVQRKPIGIKAEPPSEIAKKLINMILELRSADSIYQELCYRSYFINSISEKREIDMEYKKTLQILNQGKTPPTEKKNAIISFYNLFYKFNRPDTALLTKEYLTTSYNNYKEEYNFRRRLYLDIFKSSYKFTISKTSLIIDYLNSFENSGEDATKAFLSLINKDIIGYKSIKNTMLTIQKTITNNSEIDINNTNLNDSIIDSAMLKYSSLIKEACKSLAEISRFKGAPFETILENILTKSNDTPKQQKLQLFKTKDKLSSSEENQLRNFYFDVITFNQQKLIEQLSKAAGKIIYKKLIYGTIDLSKSGAKNGEVLNIYITWILDSKKDSLSNSPRLPIGKYYLKETGWKMEIVDMFAMVKRIHETKADSVKLSPSNFKGCGGAVLMWTYNKTDKGLNIKRTDKGEYVVTRKNNLLNFFEPSLGLNVSYLDFRTDKDVEIGTGLQMGLFKNKIFFGYGVNLHMISPKNQSPFYYYIGFSFAELSDLFKNSNNIHIVQ